MLMSPLIKGKISNIGIFTILIFYVCLLINTEYDVHHMIVQMTMRMGVSMHRILMKMERMSSYIPIQMP